MRSRDRSRIIAHRYSVVFNAAKRASQLAQESIEFLPVFWFLREFSMLARQDMLSHVRRATW